MNRNSGFGKDLEPRALYIGSYTQRESHVEGRAKGISIFWLSGTLILEYQSTLTGMTNPSYLALSPGGEYLYAVNEFTGQDGLVSAYAVDPRSKELIPLNTQSSHGASPCHLSVTRDGNHVLVANYEGGNICVLPVNTDGSLNEATDIVQFSGAGPTERQSGPHAHMILADPQNRYILAVDLGADRVLSYTLDSKRGKLSPGPRPFVQLYPGTGPRHLSFHPSGRFVYVLGELNSTVTVFVYEPQTGGMQQIQTANMLPSDYSGESTGAAIRVTSDGKFLYASNRGNDSLAIFTIQANSGRLTPLGHASTLGQTPRDFIILPGGDLLIAANQDSDSLVLFRIHPRTGSLTALGEPVYSPSPVCILPFGLGN